MVGTLLQSDISNTGAGFEAGEDINWIRDGVTDIVVEAEKDDLPPGDGHAQDDERAQGDRCLKMMDMLNVDF
ncbi:OLC1v1016144C1 [Oldenlandia corymbosa var. corymbosa]|uniref:OLC1v1016144C1 n=1 Tax=Oldenlandia corymbosa var. corymbosa TaxID=529605 RepID=A0AAV1E796_OLDCO|nr:OLC1v1016144C1 [Oldenlandia corymbosa var. corymbosa]